MKVEQRDGELALSDVCMRLAVAGDAPIGRDVAAGPARTTVCASRRHVPLQWFKGRLGIDGSGTDVHSPDCVARHHGARQKAVQWRDTQ